LHFGELDFTTPNNNQANHPSNKVNNKPDKKEVLGNNVMEFLTSLVALTIFKDPDPHLCSKFIAKLDRALQL
jgi:hypothetical protein